MRISKHLHTMPIALSILLFFMAGHSVAQRSPPYFRYFEMPFSHQIPGEVQAIRLHLPRNASESLIGLNYRVTDDRGTLLESGIRWVYGGRTLHMGVGTLLSLARASRYSTHCPGTGNPSEIYFGNLTSNGEVEVNSCSPSGALNQDPSFRLNPGPISIYTENTTLTTTDYPFSGVGVMTLGFWESTDNPRPTPKIDLSYPISISSQRRLVLGSFIIAATSEPVESLRFQALTSDRQVFHESHIPTSELSLIGPTNLGTLAAWKYKFLREIEPPVENYFISATITDSVGVSATVELPVNGATRGVGPPTCPDPPENGVKVTNGNHTHQERDTNRGGATQLPFDRFQNSGDGQHAPNGVGSSNSLHEQIIITEAADGSTHIIHKSPRGHRQTFKLAPDGSFKSCECDGLTLSRLPDGSFLMRNRAGGQTLFNSFGQVIKRSSLAGDVMDMTYDAKNRLASAKTDIGTELRFAYGTNNKMTSLVDDAGRTVQYFYNKDDKLSSVVDPAGFRTTYGYDGMGKLTQVTDAEGRTRMSAQFDGSGRARTVQVGGVTTNYEYNTAEKVTTRTVEGVGTFRTRYNEQGRTLEEITPFGSTTYELAPGTLAPRAMEDELGRVTTFQTDAEGNPTQITAPGTSDPVLRTLGIQRATIGGVNRPVQFQYPTGKVATLNYNADGTLDSYIPPDSGAIQFEYPAGGRQPTRVVTEEGNLVETTYGPHGLPTSQTFGRINAPETLATVRTEYDRALNMRGFTDASGIRTEVEHDARGLPILVKNALGQSTTLERDSAGNVKAVIDALNRRLETIFDGANHPLTTKNALGQVTTMTYGPDGRVKQIENFRGEKWIITRDALGHPIEMKDPLGGISKTFYNAASEVTSVKDALDRETKFERDDQGRVIKQTNPDLTFRTITYHPDGQLASVTDELQRTTQYSWDGSGRVISITDQEGDTQRFAYTTSGQVDSYTDPLGRVTRYEYNDHGQQTAVKPPDGGDFNVEPSEYRSRLDAEGKLLGFKPPAAGEWTYEHDALGRVRKATDPHGRSWETLYDAGGRMIQAIEPGESGALVTEVFYDNLDRPKEIRKPDQTITFTYRDELNEVEVKLEPENIVISRRLDALSRLVEEKTTQVVNGAQDVMTLGYAYDAASNLTEVTRNGVPQLRYSYDDRDRVTKIEDRITTDVVDIAYDEAGQVIEVKYPNGMVQDLTYTPKGEVLTMAYRSASGSPIRHLTYDRDAASQILQIIDLNFQGPADQVTYQWDARGRVRTANAADVSYTETLEYDADSNITRQELTTPARAASRALRYGPGDELLEIRDADGQLTNLTYDARGNLALMASSGPRVSYIKAFTWDAENRLVRVDLGGVPRLEASYLEGYALNREKTPSRDLVHTWLGGNIFSSRDYVTRQEVDRTLSAPGLLDGTLARGPPNDRRIPFADLQGSALGETDETGGVIGSRRYTLMGQEREGNLTGRDGFHGARLAREAGLYYLRNRWYDPELGRFISRDPIGFDGGTNLYSFVDGQPLIARDPEGLHSPLWRLLRGGPDRTDMERASVNIQRGAVAAGGLGLAAIALPEIIIIASAAKTYAGASLIVASLIGGGMAIGTGIQAIEARQMMAIYNEAIASGTTPNQALLRAERFGLKFEGFLLLVSAAGMMHSLGRRPFCKVSDDIGSGGGGASGGAAGSGGRAGTEPEVVLDLFSGKTSQVPGAIGVDLEVTAGVVASTEQLPFKAGSVIEIIVSGPQAEFLAEAARVLRPGGQIFINATKGNPYGKIRPTTPLDALGLRVIQKAGPLHPRFAGQVFRKTNGTEMPNAHILTTILEKVQ